MPKIAKKDPVYDAGMKGRCRILGGEYVDRALNKIRPHTQDFQDYVVRSALTDYRCALLPKTSGQAARSLL